MNKMTVRALVAAVLLGLLPEGTNAQSFATVGSRASGMGGAFVGVADDASAIYWNPAGLAPGAFFSLVLDTTQGEAAPDTGPAEERSSYLLGLSIPALGLGYYRLSATSATAPFLLTGVDGELGNVGLTVAPEIQLNSLVTHHAGLTLVQSITQGVAVGTTLKLVRGIAGSRTVTAPTAEDALERFGEELLGRASNKFDADVGVMAYGGPLKIGLTFRNVTEPSFEAAGSDHELALERQLRAGVSYALTSNWLAAADLDLLEISDVFGERRDLALGVEGRLARRVVVRSGLTFNVADDDPFRIGQGHAYSVGGSFAVRGSIFVDGFFSSGDDRAGHQWGIGARFVY